jgi:hypothetical protein
MSMEIAAAATALMQGSPAAGAAGGQVQAGYGVSLTDFGGFQQALANASARLEARPVSTPPEAAKLAFKPFDHINNEALQISEASKAAQAAGKDLTPGDMVMLTARCQEFAFHCQLMASVANKTSDGLSQMFRQQS